MQTLDRRGKLSISSFVTVDSSGTKLTVQKSGMFAVASLWDSIGGRDPPHVGGGRVPIVEDTCGRWRSSSNHLHTIGMRSSVDLSTPRLSSHKRFNPSQAKLNVLSQNIRSRFLRLFVCLAVSSVKPLTPSFGFPSSHCWRGVTFSPAAGLMWAGG